MAQWWIIGYESFRPLKKSLLSIEFIALLFKICIVELEVVFIILLVVFRHQHLTVTFAGMESCFVT